MFDTVNFWIASDKYVESEIIEKFYEASIDVIEKYSSKYDSHTYSCKLKNYKIYINPKGISLQGSIAKYVFDDGTIQFANRLKYKKGIEEIFDFLNIDLNYAIVMRVDIGQNLKLNNDITSYYPLLVNASYLERSVFLNSLYFKNGSKELIFYDKGAERKGKGFDKYSDNLLRYELKLKKNPSGYLKAGKLYAKDLYKKPIYEQLINAWYHEFKKIRTTSGCTSHLNFTNAKDLKNNLAALALSVYEIDIFSQLKVKISKGEINSINAHRCRKLITELKSRKSEKIDGKDLLKELNSKMEIKYKQCLKFL